MKLAQYVLRDQPEWTDEKITAAMQAGTERAVALKQPLPIYLVYFTAWEEDGALKTVPDVYGIDRRHDGGRDGAMIATGVPCSSLRRACSRPRARRAAERHVRHEDRVVRRDVSRRDLRLSRRRGRRHARRRCRSSTPSAARPATTRRRPTTARSSSRASRQWRWTAPDRPGTYLI